MTEIIDFRTGKKRVIKNRNKKEDKIIRTIEFLEQVIKELKQENLDPERCIVLAKWNSKEGFDQFQYWHNQIPTETFISLLELNKDKFLQDIKEYD